MLKSLSGAFPLPWFGGPLWKAIFFGHYVLVLGQVVGQAIALDVPAAWDIPGNLD